MDHSGREDRKLSEVKAVLRGLQGHPAGPEPAGLPSAEANTGHARWMGGTTVIIVMAAVAVVLVVAYAFSGPTQPTSTRDRTPENAAIKVLPAAGPNGPSVVTTTAAGRREPAEGPPTVAPEPGSQPTTPQGTVPDSRLQPFDRARATARPALDAALALMSSGRVRLARQRLLAMAANGSPDVAWALARSYDPNSLSAIADADADPDVEEAARWYRTWYAAAVKQGLVADSVSLERVIGSMRR